MIMYRIGIDLGGTNIAAGLVDDDYKLVLKKSTPTLANRAPEEIVADMARLCLDICAEKGLDIKDIANIGIATPGIANPVNGCVEYTNNLPFRRFPIVDILANDLGIDRSTVKIANDANAAAWGEAVAGAAKGSSSNIMVTLGTGVGGGVIIDNKILVGFNSAAGELGHIVIEKDGVPCSCGRRGCWEAYSSATALIRMTKEAIEECKKSGRYTSMLKAERISGRTACEAMRAGDEVGKEVYDKYVKYLATGVANLINIFQPEVISLGGGVSNEGQSLIDAILPIVRAEQYGSAYVDQTQVRIATLGNDAGIIGAAALE